MKKITSKIIWLKLIAFICFLLFLQITQNTFAEGQKVHFKNM